MGPGRQIRSVGTQRSEPPGEGRGRGGVPCTTPLWDTDACARPVPSGTKQKCKAKVKEESSLQCHRRLSL